MINVKGTTSEYKQDDLFKRKQCNNHVLWHWIQEWLSKLWSNFWERVRFILSKKPISVPKILSNWLRCAIENVIDLTHIDYRKLFQALSVHTYSIHIMYFIHGYNPLSLGNGCSSVWNFNIHLFIVSYVKTFIIN